MAEPNYSMLITEVRRTLRIAQVAYDQVSEAGDFRTCLAALGQVEELIQKAREDSPGAGGAVQGDLPQIEQQARELRKRVDVAFEAATAPRAREGLLKLRELMHLQGADAPLAALAQRLEQRVLGEVPGLLARADMEIKAGNLTEALDLLRQAHDIQPTDPDIAAQYAALQQRRRLEERLRQAESDATAKLATGSEVDAAKAYRLGLEALLEPGAGLPTEAAQLAQELLLLANQDLGLALGQTGPWEQAQSLLGQLGRLSSQDWAARRAYQFADAWATLAHDNALRGVRASAAQMHDWLGAYRAAKTLMYLHPQDEAAIREGLDAGERIIGQLSESISRRVARARAALAEGDAARALQDLANAEADFYAPVKAEFPELVENSEIEQARDEAARLQRQGEALQVLEGDVLPHLVAAEAAFVSGHLDEAEQELEMLPYLESVPLLAERVRGLQERITAARAQAVRQAFRDVLTTAQVGLRGATTVAQLGEIGATLSQLRASNTLLLEQDRQDHFALVELVRQERQALAAGQKWEEQAMVALNQGEYLQAQVALEEALKVVREGGRQAALRIQLDEVRPKVEQQRLRSEKEQEGRGLFEARQYLAARQVLLAAQRLGAPVDDLLQAVRAGTLLERAQKRWDEQQDGEGAQADLAEALTLIEGNPDGEGIASEAWSLQKRLAWEWASLLATHDDLRMASVALAHGDLAGADEKVRKILSRAPANAEAQALQEQIRRIYRAQTEYQKAIAERDAGRYDTALTLVDAILGGILPDWPEALALRRQIEASRDADSKLVQAENLARNRRFQQARKALEQAAELGVEPERLYLAQDQVQDLQQKWESAAFTSIQYLFRDGKYGEALGRCVQALSEAASPDFQANLTALQVDIVTRWAEEDLWKLRERRQQAQSDADLAGIEADLERLTHRQPVLPENQARQVEGFRREVKEQRLLQRLVAAEQQVKDNAWAAALETVTEALEIANVQKLPNVVVKANSMKWEIEGRRQDEAASKIEALLQQARSAWRDRLFSTAGETLKQEKVKGWLCGLSEVRLASLEPQVAALREEVFISQEVWSKFTGAKELLDEGRRQNNTDKVREADVLLQQVIDSTRSNEVVGAIKDEAKDIQRTIWLGTYLLQGNMKEVERRLIVMLAITPGDASLLTTLRRVQATRYLEESSEQVKTINQQIANNQFKRHEQLEVYSKSVRSEAAWWYRASLFGAAIAFTAFVYALAKLIRGNEALSYLTPLYTLVPAMLSTLFFNQYSQAIRRVDEERARVWGQVEEYEKRKLIEIEAIRAQTQSELRDYSEIGNPTQTGVAVSPTGVQPQP